MRFRKEKNPEELYDPKRSLLLTGLVGLVIIPLGLAATTLLTSRHILFPVALPLAFVLSLLWGYFRHLSALSKMTLGFMAAGITGLLLLLGVGVMLVFVCTRGQVCFH